MDDNAIETETTYKEIVDGLFPDGSEAERLQMTYGCSDWSDLNEDYSNATAKKIRDEKMSDDDITYIQGMAMVLTVSEVRSVVEGHLAWLEEMENGRIHDRGQGS